MRYYLGPWVKELLPSIHWRAPTGVVGSIDLRSIPAHSTAGIGFFTTPDAITLDIDYLDIGQGDLRLLTVPVFQRIAIATALGLVSVTGPTLMDCLWDILTLRADPTGATRVRPLMPTIQGNLEIHLGGHSQVASRGFNLGMPEAANVIAVIQEDYRRIRAEALNGKTPDPEIHRRVLDALGEKFRVDNPEGIFIPADLPKETRLPHRTTITDNFTRADSTTLGASSEGWSWTELEGNIDIVTNRAAAQTTGTFDTARADSDLSSADHYSQAICRFNGGGYPGVMMRKDSSATLTYYSARLVNTLDKVLAKYVSGTETTLGTNHAAHAVNTDFTVKGTANGSTITFDRDGGTETESVTDTAITGNLRCGIGGFLGIGSTQLNDDFVAADLAAGGSAISSTGTGTLTARGASTAAVPLSSSGVGTFTATGASTASAALNAAGIGAFTATGVTLASGALSSAGAANLTAATASIASGAFSFAGIGTFVLTGASIAAAPITATGTGTANWVGEAVVAGSALSVTGASTMVMTGASRADAAISADGVGTADFDGFGGAPAPPAPAAAPLPGEGGAWARWSGIGRKRRREIEREDLELIAIIKEAAPHLMQHHRTLH